MEKIKKRKKISASATAAVVLAVLLVVATTVSATLAWFASRDSAAGSMTLGQPVIVNVTQADASAATALTFEVASDYLLPGMLITPDIAVTLQASNTATILRARLDSTVEGVSTALADQLNDDFRDVLTPRINAGWRLNEDDGWYYFLGTTGQNARVMTTTAEASTLTTPVFGATLAEYGAVVAAPRAWETTQSATVLGSLVPGAAAHTVDFLTNDFRLPTTITNEFANAEIILTFQVEALQDFLVISDANVLPTLANAITIFNIVAAR